jgi:catechol 2,3-dioxygenase-like lactoylglutathione lyase family enzyme
MTQINNAAPTVCGIHHLKVPVSDLEASLDWFERALGAERQPELDHRKPDGELFAVIIRIPGIKPFVGLRHNPDDAGRASGLDFLTFAVDTRETLEAWAERLDQVGVEHSQILVGLSGWLLVTRTPDHLYMRFYTLESHSWDPDHADFESPWLYPNRGG